MVAAAMAVIPSGMPGAEMNRRKFLATLALARTLRPARELGSRCAPGIDETQATQESAISFETSDSRYQALYLRALEVLASNVTTVTGYSQPVLIEGSNYRGIWLESAPHEGLVYSRVRPDIARNNHLAFFALQREDGQLPCWSRTGGCGFAQIQMAVPIAATAWELCEQSGDSELLEKAYQAGSRWDDWLVRYRNTRRTGLCEGFCTWDTGQDNSPRWAGIPNRCPDGDARKCPALASLPRLCPDLSASVYGGRVALAAMAEALGKKSESERWLGDAERIRAKIISCLYLPSEASFYDRDAHDQWVRIRSDVISRVLGERVPDPARFETIYREQIHNRAAFWPAYPLPSIALNDSCFVRPITRNSWAGPSQALTALRAPRWMEYYGKAADLAYLMQQWLLAIVAAGEFLQQIDPVSGRFTPDRGGYSPAALIFLDFTWRLRGVRHSSDRLEWNLRPTGDHVQARYRLRIAATRTAEIRYGSGRAELFLNDKLLYRTKDTVRLVTDQEGRLISAYGIANRQTEVRVQSPSGAAKTFFVDPNLGIRFTEP